MALNQIATVLILVALTSANINITSPPITYWGEWGHFELCPFGRRAQGFQLKTEPNQYLGDDTALNAIRIFCGDPFRPDTAVVTSTQGDFGDWGNVYTCYPGVLTGFQLRVESDRGSGDDTATNNARFYCTSLSNPNDYIQGDGMSCGDWSQAQHCYGGQAICGIQTQIEPYLADNGDDTMLNNVRLECCDYSAKDLDADYARAAEIGSYPQAVNPKFAATIRKAVSELDNRPIQDKVEDKDTKIPDLSLLAKTTLKVLAQEHADGQNKLKTDDAKLELNIFAKTPADATEKRQNTS